MIQWASGIAGRCAVRPKQRNSAPPNGEGTEKMSEQNRRLRAAGIAALAWAGLAAVWCVQVPGGAAELPQGVPGTLRSLLENNTEDGSFDWGRYNPLVSIAVLLVVRFFLTAAAVPLPLPVGLYATNLIIGAALGRLFGELSKLAGVPIEPNGLSLFSLPACFTLQNKPS